MMNAQEAKMKAQDFLKSQADKVYKKIEAAASNGQYYINVDPSLINDEVKIMLENDGYKVEYRNSGGYRSVSYEYKITWK